MPRAKLLVLAFLAHSQPVSFSALDEREAIVRKLKAQAELQFSRRCSLDVPCLCSYDSCSSVSPTSECMSNLDFATCGQCRRGKFDLSASSIRLPAGVLKTDPQVADGLCFTKWMDQTFVQLTNLTSTSTSLSQMYIGLSTGVFAIYPGRAQNTCGDYDTRLRPWFVAASSGPKDVLIVIDISGSMLQYDRLNLAKKAALAVLDTLTFADFFTVITFSDQAVSLTPQLLQATEVNVAAVKALVNKLTTGGGTDYGAGFQTAFDVLSASRKVEASSGCNAVVIFLTDGSHTAGPEGVVSDKLARLNANASQAVIFTFGLGNNVNPRFIQEIACTYKGININVPDGVDLRGRMGTYYDYFSIGNYQNDRVSWVEAYKFATGGVIGTTASLPLYLDTGSVPILIGVVAVDIRLDEVDAATGGQSASVLQEMSRRSKICNKIQLTECQLESLRASKGGSMCPSSSCQTPPVNLTAPPCTGKTTNVEFCNVDPAASFVARACCTCGTPTPTPTDSARVGAIVGGVVGGVALLALLIGFVVWYRRRPKQYAEPAAAPPPPYQ